MVPVIENGVVSRPSFLKSFLGYEKPKICHERAEERAKACTAKIPAQPANAQLQGQIVRRPRSKGEGQGGRLSEMLILKAGIICSANKR